MKWLGTVLWLVLLMGHTGCVSTADGDGDGDIDGDVDADQQGCGEVGQECDMSPECPPQQVCVDFRCDCAFNRNYTVRVVNAGIYPRAPGNYCWDGVEPSCEYPDVYARFTFGDVDYQTETKYDTIEPIWNEEFTIFVEPEPLTTYTVWIFDEDEKDEDDEILVFSDEPPYFFLREDNLRQGGLTVQQGSDGTLTRIDMYLIPQ